MLKFLNIILREFVSFTLTLYFKNWVVTGKNHIPENGPVIFAGNHQNAFLDALLITSSSGRLPYYLARAEVFKGPLAKFLLNLIRIMPIYRFRDGIGSVRKNDAIINTCIKLLGENEMITMFPEGNHAEEWRVRPLQRGLSRIALLTEAQKNWTAGVKVVPVGIQYEEPKAFRSRVIVNFGEPIPVSDFKEAFLEDERKSMDHLTNILRDKMKDLVLHFPEENYVPLREEFMSRRPYRKDYYDQFQSDRQTLKALLRRENIIHVPSDRKISLNPLSYILALWVLVNNIIPYIAVKLLIKGIVKDPVFTASLKLIFGMVIPNIFYLGVGLTVSLVTGVWWYGLIYWAIQPGLGYFGGFDVLKVWWRG